MSWPVCEKVKTTPLYLHEVVQSWKEISYISLLYNEFNQCRSAFSELMTVNQLSPPLPVPQQRGPAPSCTSTTWPLPFLYLNNMAPPPTQWTVSASWATLLSVSIIVRSQWEFIPLSFFTFLPLESRKLNLFQSNTVIIFPHNDNYITHKQPAGGCVTVCSDCVTQLLK